MTEATGDPAGGTPTDQEPEAPPAQAPAAPATAAAPEDTSALKKALEAERTRANKAEEKNVDLTFAALKASNPWLERSDLEGVSLDKWPDKIARLAQLAGQNANPAAPTLPTPETPAVSDEQRAAMTGVVQVAGGALPGTGQPPAKQYSSNELLSMLKAGQITPAQMDEMVGKGMVKKT